MHRRRSLPHHTLGPFISAACGLLLVLGLGSCSGLKPPSLPDLPDWVPGTGNKESTPEVDPVDAPVNDVEDSSSTPEETAVAPELPRFDGGLQPGTTLEVAIYEGLRSTNRVFSETLTIDDMGELSHRDLGTVSVGGDEIEEALNTIESAFRLAGRPRSQACTTHLVAINDSPVIRIKGAVAREAFVPVNDNPTLGAALETSGGFTQGANPGKIYVIRRGLRKLLYLSDPDTLSYDLKEGDVVSVPWAL